MTKQDNSPTDSDDRPVQIASLSERLERYRNSLRRSLNPEDCCFEFFDDAECLICQISEEMNDLLPGQVVSFGKDYLEGKSHIIVGYEGTVRDDKVTFWVLVRNVAVDRRAPSNRKVSSQSGDVTCSEQEPMFVDDVQLVHVPEITSAPPFVSLHSSKDFFDFVRHHRYLSFGERRVIVPRFFLEGESGELLAATIGGDDVVGKEIERHPEIVNSISDQQGDIIRQWSNGIDAIVMHDPVRGKRSGLYLTDESIRVCLGMLPQNHFKVRDVLFGPIDLKS